MKEIDYARLIENIDTMINTCEYDSMRSAGKAKMNADVLYHLHSLKDRYSKIKPKTVPPVQKEGK